VRQPSTGWASWWTRARGRPPARACSPAPVRGLAALLVLLATAACSSPVGPGGELPGESPGRPPGADVASPFPIDRGDDGSHTPGSYKGMWLRLAGRAAPTVTAVDGVIGVVCVGMSNGAQECNQWVTQRTGAWRPEVAPAVRIVNCAVGGHAIERWNDPAYDGVLWDDCVQRRLPAAGVRLDQVRVVYHKAANQFGAAQGGGQLPPMPSASANYHVFLANLQTFAGRVRGKFPAVQAVYTTSRSYGGFASGVRGEPQAYEEGHALNTWLGTTPTVDGVWYGWGPYIWAPVCDTGITNASGVCYERADYRADAVHPTSSGELKIARLIHDRFRREAWYRP
jgi:hypothetical protein